MPHNKYKNITTLQDNKTKRLDNVKNATCRHEQNQTKRVYKNLYVQLL